jgi:hypothetical protein
MKSRIFLFPPERMGAPPSSYNSSSSNYNELNLVWPKAALLPNHVVSGV